MYYCCLDYYFQHKKKRVFILILIKIHLIQNKGLGQATQLHLVGTLTKNAEGNELAELFDMKNAGAIAFGDYKKTLTNANLLKIALQYTQSLS